MILNIQPKTFTAYQIEIYNIEYHLDGAGATFYYQFLNGSDKLKEGNIELSQEEITNWGTDDNVVIEIALAKIDVTKL